MKTKHLLFYLLFLAAVFTACEKEDSSLAPAVKMLVTDPAINGKVNQELIFMAINTNNKSYQQEWKLDEQLVSDSAGYKFTPKKPGVYRIDYMANNDAGSFSYSYSVNVGVPTVPITDKSNAYITSVFDTLAGPNEDNRLQIMTAAQSLAGKKGFVSIGNSAASLVLGFDHTVINETAKADVVVYTKGRINPEVQPQVWVMQDENGNRKPDDTWYLVPTTAIEGSGATLKIDIANALDATGKSVSLGGIDFLKIEVALPATLKASRKNNFGISGIADLSLIK